MRSGTVLLPTLVLAAAPFLLPAAEAATQAQLACPAKPLPHNVGQLTVSYDDRGDLDPANDAVAATLTLCGKASGKSAYELSLDAKPQRDRDRQQLG
jgi:hypothetical protein